MTHTIFNNCKPNPIESILTMTTRWIFEAIHDRKMLLINCPYRRLAGIFYADVSNYTGLVEEDEDGTHARLMVNMDIVGNGIRAFHGKTVHFAGDGILAEFGGISGMLECAVAVQRNLRKANANHSPQHQVRFRIGINLGEIIIDRGSIYGNAVNVAARLESLAEPGGIAVSDSVRNCIGNRLPIDYVPLGEQQVKNINQPIRAYSVEIQTDKVGKGDTVNVVQLPLTS